MLICQRRRPKWTVTNLQQIYRPNKRGGRETKNALSLVWLGTLSQRLRLQRRRPDPKKYKELYTKNYQRAASRNADLWLMGAAEQKGTYMYIYKWVFPGFQRSFWTTEIS